VTEKVPDWRFVVSKVSPRTAEVVFEIQATDGTVVAQSNRFVNLASAHNAIETIRRYAGEFVVVTNPS